MVLLPLVQSDRVLCRRRRHTAVAHRRALRRMRMDGGGQRPQPGCRARRLGEGQHRCPHQVEVREVGVRTDARRSHRGQLRGHFVAIG